jgi:hypothetical protein
MPRSTPVCLTTAGVPLYASVAWVHPQLLSSSLPATHHYCCYQRGLASPLLVSAGYPPGGTKHWAIAGLGGPMIGHCSCLMACVCSGEGTIGGGGGGGGGPLQGQGLQAPCQHQISSVCSSMFDDHDGDVSVPLLGAPVAGVARCPAAPVALGARACC